MVVLWKRVLRILAGSKACCELFSSSSPPDQPVKRWIVFKKLLFARVKISYCKLFILFIFPLHFLSPFLLPSGIIFPCQSNPCVNGGICTNLLPGPSAYFCQCPDGYGGTQCELSKNLCFGRQFCWFAATNNNRTKCLLANPIVARNWLY